MWGLRTSEVLCTSVPRRWVFHKHWTSVRSMSAQPNYTMQVRHTWAQKQLGALRDASRGPCERVARVGERQLAVESMVVVEVVVGEHRHRLEQQARMQGHHMDE